MDLVEIWYRAAIFVGNSKIGGLGKAHAPFPLRTLGFGMLRLQLCYGCKASVTPWLRMGYALHFRLYHPIRIQFSRVQLYELI